MNETTVKNTAKRVLIVFVKAPVPGDVKTRLIPHLTGTEAADLYRCFVMDVMARALVMQPGVRVLVAYQPHAKAADLSWLRSKPPLEWFRQEGKSLGERLSHAFGVAFGRGAREVAAIGTDAPSLPAEHVDQAFYALKGADVVLGPAPHGGYYLIGLSRPCLKVFDEGTFATDQVFERTAQNAQIHGYALRVLPEHYHVETMDDLKKLHGHISDNRHSAPQTKQFLSSLARRNPALFAR